MMTAHAVLGDVPACTTRNERCAACTVSCVAAAASALTEDSRTQTPLALDVGCTALPAPFVVHGAAMTAVCSSSASDNIGEQHRRELEWRFNCFTALRQQ